MRFKINFHSFLRYNIHPNKISNIGGCWIASRQMFVHRSPKVVRSKRYSSDSKINIVFLTERKLLLFKSKKKKRKVLLSFCKKTTTVLILSQSEFSDEAKTYFGLTLKLINVCMITHYYIVMMWSNFKNYWQSHALNYIYSNISARSEIFFSQI